MKNTGFQKERRSHTVLTVVFAIIAVAYLYPIFIVLDNSLKTNAAINLDTFAFPKSDTFMGLQNYIKGMTFGNYPFYKSVEYSLMITLLSAALILICTSMAAWIFPVSTASSAALCTTCSCSPWSSRSRWSCSRWQRPPIL